MTNAYADGRQVVELVGGARPNFVKLAPVHAALVEQDRLTPRVVHTGQHYDALMSDTFFSDLGIPEPDVHLAVGSGSHGKQTARVLERYEEHLLDTRPDAVVVFGDVNSTLAAALAATKLHIPVAHVEAGLRSGDRSMPEEINRILTDAIADRHFVTEPSGVEHLEAEGVPEERIALVGNTMIDTLRRHHATIETRRRADEIGVGSRAYGVVTMHRPANVDDPERLAVWLGLFRDLAKTIPLVFPVHPRTRRAAQAAGMATLDAAGEGLHPIAPERYLDHLSLMASAAVVITDSGGMQEECAFLGVPCLVLRPSTERPLTVEVGACRLAGEDVEAVRAGVRDVLAGRWSKIESVALWDGQAGARIAAALADWLSADVP